MTSNAEHVDVDDPFEEVFPLMVDAARRLCRTTTESGDRCFKYHRAWAYTRRMGFHSVVPPSAYYIDAFRELARRGDSSRVLISGTADYVMLANVLHAYRAEGVEPRVHVLDRCETPLFINRWYAARHGAEITTVACDILAYDGSSNFDVVATDHFLSRIAPQDRSRLLAVWRQALRAGGKVVTTEPVARGPVPDGPRIHTNKEIEMAGARVLERLRDNPSIIDVAPETAAEYVKQSHAVRVSYPIRSIHELTELFESHDFEIENLLRIPRRRSDRMRVVASKRP